MTFIGQMPIPSGAHGGDRASGSKSCTSHSPCVVVRCGSGVDVARHVYVYGYVCSATAREASMSAALELQHLDDSDGDKEQSLVVQVCNLHMCRR
jgi:hypothetical protein